MLIGDSDAVLYIRA